MSRPDAASLRQAENTGGLNPITALSVLDDTTRANIVGTIVGHPKGAPSKKNSNTTTRASQRRRSPTTSSGWRRRD